MELDESNHWQEICTTASGDDVLERIRVPGGWLYRTKLWDGDDAGELRGVATTFVPDPAGSE